MNSAARILSGEVIKSEFVLQDVKVDCNVKWAILRPQDQEDKNTLHLFIFIVQIYILSNLSNIPFDQELYKFLFFHFLFKYSLF